MWGWWWRDAFCHLKLHCTVDEDIKPGGYYSQSVNFWLRTCRKCNWLDENKASHIPSLDPIREVSSLSREAQTFVSPATSTSSNGQIHKAFPGQQIDVSSPVYPRSALGCSWTCPKCLQRASVSHPFQMFTTGFTQCWRVAVSLTLWLGFLCIMMALFSIWGAADLSVKLLLDFSRTPGPLNHHVGQPSLFLAETIVSGRNPQVNKHNPTLSE